MALCSNTYVSIFSNVIIQTAIIFTFLTVFFFAYVSKVENTEFKGQLEFIADSIYKRHTKDIKEALEKYNVDTYKRDYIKTLIYGIIDLEEEKIMEQSKADEDNIKKSNDTIIKNSTFYVKLFVIISIVALLLLFIFMYKKYDCYIPMKSYIKEGLIVLVFIFFIEIIFLNVVVKNYISANPNEIKNKIASSIINYIDNNK